MNVPVPDRIANAPELLPWLHGTFGAFFELATCRHENGPIPWTALYTYAQAHGISEGEELARFTGLIRAMDSAYIEDINKRHQRSKISEKPAIGKGKKDGRS